MTQVIMKNILPLLQRTYVFHRDYNVNIDVDASDEFLDDSSMLGGLDAPITKYWMEHYYGPNHDRVRDGTRAGGFYGTHETDKE